MIKKTRSTLAQKLELTLGSVTYTNAWKNCGKLDLSRTECTKNNPTLWLWNLCQECKKKVTTCLYRFRRSLDKVKTL